MTKSRARFLIDQLISNSLSEGELEELLTSIGENEMEHEYSDVLENYFNSLIQKNISNLEDVPPGKN
jgi:hypothetical protein